MSRTRMIAIGLALLSATTLRAAEPAKIGDRVEQAPLHRHPLVAANARRLRAEEGVRARLYEHELSRRSALLARAAGT